MEDIEFKCFVCDTPLPSPNVACPKCGYKFDETEDLSVCPNCKYGVCLITENMCTKGENYFDCPEKLKIDKESF